WSSSMQTTGWPQSRSISVLLASPRPTTLRANSMTAHCSPRQIPKNGTCRSRAKRIASILPAMPRSPKPPGTSMPPMPPRPRPSRCASHASGLALATNSRVGRADAGLVERFVDRFVRVVVLVVLADARNGHFVSRVHAPLEQFPPVVDLQRPGPQVQLLDDQL